MKTLTFITILALMAFTQTTNNCASVKTGKFVLNSDNFGSTLIERSSDKQIETNDSMKTKVTYSISWTDSCNYKMFDAAVMNNSRVIYGNPTDTLFVEITEVNSNGYKSTTTSNYNSESYDGELSFY